MSKVRRQTQSIIQWFQVSFPIFVSFPIQFDFRLFDDAKVQHESDKSKLMDEINALKETNHTIESENQSLKLRNTEHKSTIESQKERIR